MTAALEQLRERVLHGIGNEATALPFWIIIDPAGLQGKKKIEPHSVAFAVDGVWFSRKAAEAYLAAQHYNYSDQAVVWCASGHASRDWRELLTSERPR